MRSKDNITGGLFEYINFSESIIYFHPPWNIEDSFHIEIWGITLKSEGFHLVFPELDVLVAEDVIIVGKSKIIFEKMGEGIVEVALYNDAKNDFLYLSNKEILRINKKWGRVSSAESCFYYLCGVFDWPYGYCEIGFNGAGSVEIEIDLNKIIPVKEYITDPAKYLENIL